MQNDFQWKFRFSASSKDEARRFLFQLLLDRTEEVIDSYKPLSTDIQEYINVYKLGYPLSSLPELQDFAYRLLAAKKKSNENTNFYEDSYVDSGC
jgi:hypothetical protein